MLLSQACSLGRATSLGQPHQRHHFERSSSGCLHGLPPAAALKRSTSGPVHVQAYSGSSCDGVLYPTRKQDAPHDPSQTSACIAFPDTRKPSTKQEFQANFGTAIRSESVCYFASSLIEGSLKRINYRKLRNDIPCTLQRSPDMEIFANNIMFTDNISPKLGHQTNRIQGLDAYGRQMWSLRFHAALLFSKSHVSAFSAVPQRLCSARQIATASCSIHPVKRVPSKPACADQARPGVLIFSSL